MRDPVNVRDFRVIIDASPESVFDFVVDVRNLPKWAIHFCEDARVVDNGAVVTTPRGEMYFGITGDRDLGVLDWWAGPTMETAQRWPTRVVPLADGRSLYSVTAIFGAQVPPDIEQQFAEELNLLAQLAEERQPVAA